MAKQEMLEGGGIEQPEWLQRAIDGDIEGAELVTWIAVTRGITGETHDQIEQCKTAVSAEIQRLRKLADAGNRYAGPVADALQRHLDELIESAGIAGL